MSLIREPCLPQFPLSKHESHIPSKSKFLYPSPVGFRNPRGPPTSFRLAVSLPLSSPLLFFIFNRIQVRLLRNEIPSRTRFLTIVVTVLHLPFSADGATEYRFAEARAAVLNETPWRSGGSRITKLRQSVYPTRFKEEPATGNVANTPRVQQRVEICSLYH